VNAAQLRRALGRALLAAVLVSVLVFAAIQSWYLGRVIYWRWNNPSMTSFMLHAQERLSQRRPPGALQRQWVPYAQISGHLKRAVVAAEDARFIEHDGVDWEAMEKAYHDNQKRGHRIHGASTISQQVAKNLFLSGERTYVRKAQELLITWMLEAVWGKRRILEVYLNVAEWGDGVFGAQAASRHYYGVDAAALSPEQAARLAAMLPAPRIFDRYREAPFLGPRTDSILHNLPFAQVP
jgi:monofunctional glycosyltransferase